RRPRGSWPRWSTGRWCCAITSTPARCPGSYCAVRWPADRARTKAGASSSGWHAPHPDGFVLRINPGRRVPADHLSPVLIHRRNGEIDEMLPAFFPDSFHGGLGGENISRPHLAREAHPVFGQAPVADVVREHLTRHAHGEHAVGEHRGVSGHFSGEDLVRMDGVVI